MTQDVTITITGTNDEPTIVVTQTTTGGAVVEDTNVNRGRRDRRRRGDQL